MKRVLVAASLAASLFATNLIAAEASAPLASGKPATVKQAQEFDTTTVLVVGGVAALGLGLALDSGGSSSKITPSSGTG